MLDNTTSSIDTDKLLNSSSEEEPSFTRKPATLPPTVPLSDARRANLQTQKLKSINITPRKALALPLPRDQPDSRRSVQSTGRVSFETPVNLKLE